MRGEGSLIAVGDMPSFVVLRPFAQVTAGLPAAKGLSCSPSAPTLPATLPVPALRLLRSRPPAQYDPIPVQRKGALSAYNSFVRALTLQ